MKRDKTLSVYLILIGSILIILSELRWLQIYNDPSNAFFGIISGFILIMLGYLNQRVSDNYNEINEIHIALDSFNNWTTLEFKKIHSIKEIGEILKENENKL